jgi:hypothetical protein
MPETAAVLVKVLRRALEEQLAATIAHPAWLGARSSAAASGSHADPGAAAAQQKARLVLGATAEFLRLGAGGT